MRPDYENLGKFLLLMSIGLAVPIVAMMLYIGVCGIPPQKHPVRSYHERHHHKPHKYAPSTPEEKRP